MAIALSRRMVLSTAAVATVAPSLAHAATAINGGGSSFVAPVMKQWIDTVPASLGVRPSYEVLGTGTAQSRIMAGELDYAAVELPLPADKLEAAEMDQFPVAFGALAFVVNIEGMASNQLTLDGRLLGGIYAGQIRTWNDPRIAAANPGVKLPDMEIRPVHLGDPAGSVFSTTFTIQQYLLAKNEDWRAKYGATITKRWAVGSMTTSAAQMLEAMKVLPGSMGYVTLAAAVQGKMTTVRLRNADGQAVAPSLDVLRASVDRIDWARTEGLVPRLLDLPGKDSWPIVLASYAMLQRQPKDRMRGAAVRAFMKYVVAEGSGPAAQRFAIGLPAAARDTVLRRLGSFAG